MPVTRAHLLMRAYVQNAAVSAADIAATFDRLTVQSARDPFARNVHACLTESLPGVSLKRMGVYVQILRARWSG